MTEPLAYIDDYEKRVASLTPGALRHLPRWSAILAAWGGELRDLDEAVYLALTDGRLDSAGGETLLRYGLLVGEPGAGLSESDHRRLISGRIASNTSDGSREAVAAVWSALTSDTSQVRDAYPAAVIATAVVPEYLSPEVAERTGRIFVDALPAGIGASLTVAIAGAFVLGSSTDPGPGVLNLAGVAQAIPT